MRVGKDDPTGFSGGGGFRLHGPAADRAGKTKAEEPVSSKTRVAVVVDRVQDYQVPLIRGMESVLRASDVALFVVVSHPLHSRRSRMLRRLLSTGDIHALAITAMTDPLTGLSRVAEIVRFAKDLPCVTIGVQLPGIPALLPDNIDAVRAVMAHLLDDCGRSRPMLVAGPEDNDDSRERESAFLAVAAERGLELPRTPVVHANFEREWAYRGIIELLAAGRDFDAVVAANDDMAMGVLDALHEQGVRIPQDVAVVGFDNTSGAYRSNPPLSSVDAQLEEQGQVAARLLQAQLAGVAGPAQVRVAAPLVIRGSSAMIPSDLALRTLVGAPATAPASADPTPLLVNRVLAALTPVNGAPQIQARLKQLGMEWLPKVMSGTLTLDRSEELAALLRDMVGSHPEPLWWRQLTATLQAAVAAASPDGLVPDAVQAGILRIALRTDRALGAVREARDREQLSVSQHVLELNRALSGCRSLGELTREISAYLPRLNIRRCFLVLFERQLDDEVGNKAGQARLAMSYRDGVCDPDPDRTSFAVEQLLPRSLARELDHGTLTIQPLFSGERGFGLVLHEQSTLDRHTGEALRRDASGVLDAIARAEELTERAVELENLVAERTAQLEREVASRQAAQESLREANNDLRRALLLDGLTGLQNRPSFDEHLVRTWHRHLRNSEPLSVLMVDVDHFKLYNDTYGHLAGDKCLRLVAACLQAAVARNEDIVARYGGEEFAVILPDTGPHGALLVADRLLKEVRTAAIPHSASNSPAKCLSVSIGIGSTTTAGANTLERLLGFADQALYSAKRDGRDRARQYEAP
jgi:diguanylate cyclase (GGDEF)-like protein